MGPRRSVAGLTAKRTTLHLTSRLLELLNESQLEAVLAHELSHVGQRDSVLMSAVGSPVAAMLDGASLYFHAPIRATRAARDAGTRRITTSDPSSPSLVVLLADEGIYFGVVWLLLLPIGLLFVVVGAACRAITALFSRSRELEADAGAAQLTGNPSALASALVVISETPLNAVPQVDLRRAASLDVFHIVAIGREYPLLHTHPSLRRRLKQLSAMESRLQRTASKR